LKHGFKIIVSRAHQNGAFKVQRHGLSAAKEDVLAAAHVLQGLSHSSAADNDGGSHLGGGDGHGGVYGGYFEPEGGGCGENGEGESGHGHGGVSLES